MYLFAIVHVLVWFHSMKPTTPFNYDLVVIGGGAAGMFAAGIASSTIGKKTAIIDIRQHLGGDCTNAACVPSKALRSIVRRSPQTIEGAQEHVRRTVQAVRNREQPSDLQKRNPNLDTYLVQSCRFIGSHTLELSFANATVCTVQSSRFLLAVGADPIIPLSFQTQAKLANLPLWTYRSILQPENVDFWESVQNGTLQRLVIVGGGPTACELGQSLGRLLAHNTSIDLVAPAILPEEDPYLQQAGLKLLERAGVSCSLNVTMDAILQDKSLQLSDGTILPPTDGVLLCIGRRPALDSLHLDQAGVQWSHSGVQVHPSTLQSTTAPHIFAAGDCTNLIDKRSRTSAHAAWMGYHAVRNMFVPWFLRVGSPSQHKVVPRVIYTDPELACVGLTQRECKERYQDFQSIHVREEGSDRADMERMERDTDVNFLEWRASPSGQILGLTACGPAAAELANSIGVAITNKLAVKDIAKAIHSYPSHGYLLYRVALSMALNDVSGFLSSCGPVGKGLGWIVRMVASVVRILRSMTHSILHVKRRKKLL